MKKKTVRKSQDWLSLLQQESRETGKPIEQLLAEKAGPAHPSLLKLHGPPWDDRERITISFNISKAEERGLKWLRKAHCTSEATLNELAFIALNIALMRPGVITSSIQEMLRYSEAEGMERMIYIRSRIWASCPEEDDEDNDE